MLLCVFINWIRWIATAALVDQVDRALAAPASSADHRAIAGAIAATTYRLGYRGDTPLQWLPWHLPEKHLREDNMIEAYLLAKMRMKRHTRMTGRKQHKALDAARGG